MATQTETVQIGDKVIYIPTPHGRPVITVITRVTPSGQIGIAEAKKPFRRNKYGERDRFTSGSMWSDKEAVYLFSDERLASLNERAAAHDKNEREKREELARQTAERERVDREQAAEVRRVCNGILPITVQETLPNNSRFYLLDVPVNPEYAEKQFDRLIVQVRDEERFNRGYTAQEIKPVADSAYITARRGFSGRSSVRGESDESILWDLVQDRYFDWN